MTLSRLILAGLRHDWRAHAGVTLGAALTCAVVTGALVVGDSVRHTLHTTALQRLGQVTHVVAPGDRMFTAALADRLAPQTPGDVAAALLVRGVVGRSDGEARALDVQILGIDDAAGQLIGGTPTPEPGEAILNAPLAHRLNIDDASSALPELIVRLPDPRAVHANLPINDEAGGIVMRPRARAIVANNAGGRFSLRAEQAPPRTLFVNRQWLAEQIGLPGRANLIVSANAAAGVPLWLDDAELEVTPRPDAGFELRTPRVFIDRATTDALAPLADTQVLTYLANTLAHGDHATPYAMVAGTDAPLDGLTPGHIIINQWLADDLQAGVGDTLRLDYYQPDEGARLVEASATFTVARIVPIEGLFADRTLTPDFPGLDTAQRLADWDGGPGIDRARIRPIDERYWDQHRATPKAFITLADAQRLWANRYGNLTALRFAPGTDPAQLAAHLDPPALGFTPRDVRGEALRASAATVDFGVLFLSLSMFVIAAAAALTAMLFGFGVERRARQLGTLLALGWTRGQVRRWLLGEALGVAGLGVVLGTPAGLAYAHVLVDALSGRWSGAVADTAITFAPRPQSLAVGGVGALALALLGAWWVLGRTTKRDTAALLAGATPPAHASNPKRRALPLVAAAALAAAAAALVLTAPAGTGPRVAGVFFGSGALLLVGGLLGLAALLRQPRHAAQLSLPRLAARNTARRPGRSLTAAGLIAAGLFTVAAVVGFAPYLPDTYTDRSSGTGGFALLGRTTLPLTADLNTPAGRDRFALDADELPPGSVVPLWVSPGDDASCLNLNKPPQPRVLGVGPTPLAERDAFTLSNPDGWAALRAPQPDHAIPALADANTAQWALHLPVGATLTLADGRGQPLTLRLVGTIDNSILQGSLIIAEDNFRRHFPDVAGPRMLLLDCPPDQLADRQAILSRQLEDLGLALEPTLDRLAAFNTVQQTYLRIFQLLGALGVTLGCAGLGIVAARNILERRPQLAMLQALGFDRPRLRRLLLLEHLILLALGLALAALAAAVALAPAMRDASATAALTPLALTALACAAATAAAVAAAARAALHGRLLDAIRDE